MLKIDASGCEIEVLKATGEPGHVRRLARFVGELGRLLQVGYGRPFDAQDGDSYLKVEQRGSLIQFALITREGIRNVCKMLRQDFYDAIMRGLRVSSHRKRSD